MSEARPVFRLAPMPLLRTRSRLSALHGQSMLALAPLLLVAFGLYGLPALRTAGVAAASFLLAEAFTKAVAGNRQRTLDGHALLGGLVFALLLPPDLHWSQVMLAGGLGAFLAEQLFGGYGRAAMHPALFARLLLDLVAQPGGGLLTPLWWLEKGWFSLPASVPVTLKTQLQQAWQALAELEASTEHGLVNPPVDVPLTLSRLAQLQERLSSGGVLDFVWNLHPGTLGAASLLALLPGGVLLVTRRVIDWKVPVTALAVFGTGVLLVNASGLAHWPAFSLWCSGSFLLPLLVFGAAESVHTPLTARGRLSHGLLLGSLLLAVPALHLGEAGLVLATLAASALVPWLNQSTLPRGPRR
ncbi:MAG: RnfABCDGE type electron transport complex subunit D [Calditrichaeota bacterium]|nr:RnfABCDGE type electron transport complex subunit D [Calditrichota bacterium]MCB9472224.1 RnfABCDGE type electron transport complex subunit D [Candidatus Delongbacteria bacterium]MCB9475186.1 RnfABCDGE type electron transport complex subunit D [Candidatus Delongbacteria bacterium]